MDGDKERHVDRYLRGAKKFEERKDNLAEKKLRGASKGRRARPGDDDDDEGGDDAELEEAWDGDELDGDLEGARSAEAARPRRPTPKRNEPATADEPRSATAVETRVVEVARTEVRVAGAPGAGDRVVRLIPKVLLAGGVVVGDGVLLDGPQGGAGPDARVVARLPRRTLLARRAPGSAHATKLLAANVDLGLVVLAPRERGLSLGFLDRALATFEAGDIEPVIVVTKLDLLSDAERARCAEELEPWRALGHATHFVSAPTGEGLDGLRRQLAGRVSVLLGHSGVGKSTLINALDPSAARAVGTVRESDGRGKHTTTASRLVPFLCEGEAYGALVDTPGVRALVPDAEGVAGLAAGIPELAPYLGQCRFSDCSHSGEPGCALLEHTRVDPALASALERLRRLVASLNRNA